MKLIKYLFSVGCMLLLVGCGGASDAPSDESSSENSSSSESSIALAAENEPYFKYCWHLQSENSALNTSGYTIDDSADINVTEAWKRTKGAGVKVAVIDDAFDVEHEDLKSNIVQTYNADDQSSDVSNSVAIGTTDEDGYPADGSHGNTCAGFIVAPVNNKGIVGVAPESKLIAIKLTDQSDSSTIEAFEYAKNHGANVISCSWGTEAVSQSIEDVLKSLYEAGITVLFASGNDGKDLDVVGIDDESELEWVIGIGASGESNDVTSYSNYGKNIDLLAPGGDVETSIGILGIDDTGVRGDDNQQNLVTNSYAFTNGTSFATPVAAGVVALMYGVNSEITPDQVRTILIDTAEKVGGQNANYVDGFDSTRAYGKINAGKAIEQALSLQ